MLHLQLITSAVSKTSAISYPARSHGSHSLVACSDTQPGRWSSFKYLRHIGSSTDSIFIITCLPHLDLWNRVTSLTHLDLLSLVFPPSHTSTCKQVGCEKKLSGTISAKPECDSRLPFSLTAPSTPRRSSVYPRLCNFLLTFPSSSCNLCFIATDQSSCSCVQFAQAYCCLHCCLCSPFTHVPVNSPCTFHSCSAVYVKFPVTVNENHSRHSPGLHVLNLYFESTRPDGHTGPNSWG